MSTATESAHLVAATCATTSIGESLQSHAAQRVCLRHQISIVVSLNGQLQITLVKLNANSRFRLITKVSGLPTAADRRGLSAVFPEDSTQRNVFVNEVASTPSVEPPNAHCPSALPLQSAPEDANVTSKVSGADGLSVHWLFKLL